MGRRTISITDRKPVGSSGVSIPGICFGTSALGDMPNTYGYSVDEERAAATIKAIFSSPFGFLDVSRNYGMGRSEERIGNVIKELGGLPENCLISTKLDRDMETLRFDAGRARQSLEESLVALNVDKVSMLHLHDPEHVTSLDEVTRPGGALTELFKMKEEGLADCVGLAAGNVDIMIPILMDWPFDALITHNRFTLTNRNAEAMMDLAMDRDIAVLNAAPFAGGALAKGATEFPRYVYQKATDDMLEPIRRVEAVCAKHGIPPGAAALQFSIRDPRIVSTVCGVSKPERIEQTIEWANWPISETVWAELLALPAESSDPETTRQYDSG